MGSLLPHTDTQLRRLVRGLAVPGLLAVRLFQRKEGREGRLLQTPQGNKKKEEEEESRKQKSYRAGKALIDFFLLQKNLRDSFSRSDLTLSVSLAGYPSVLEVAYDLKAVGEAADVVNVMTYDYHGFWDGKTGHHSPLRRLEGDPPGHNAV